MSVDDLVFDEPQVAPVDEQQIQEDAPVVEEQQVATPEPIAGDERTLPRWIRDLKATRPTDFAAAKDSFFGQKSLSEKVKDRDLDKIFGFMDENGGLDGLTASRAELQASKEEYDSLLADVASGNPAIADRLFEASGARSGDIARAVMTKYASTDPQGWSDHLTPVFAATIMQGQALGLDGKTQMSVPDMLTEARYALQFASTLEQKAEIAQNALNSITGFLAGFTNAQPKSAAPSQQKVSVLDEREKSLNEREQKQFTDGVTAELGKAMLPEIQAALKTYFDRRPEDKDAQNLATSTVWREINERLAKDANYGKQWDAFMARKDSAGALKLAASRRKEILGEIATRNGRTIFGNPTPKAPVATKPVPAAVRASSVPAASGFDAIWDR